jgi:putative PIN family toxin of toxin-antitoxin system
LRVLLDTNVIISGILFGGFARELLGKALRGEIALVTSPVLLDELEDLLAAKFSFSPAAARETRRELEALGDVVEPTEIPDVCRDADDNAVMAAAGTGGAEAIVTGDEDLLVLGVYRKIPILRPADLVHRLRGG